MKSAGRDEAAKPIGVFDSGVGGLTVVRALMEHLPRESFVYLGDTARVPYGTKSPQTVIRFSLQNAEYLRRWDVKMIVVACHSASSCALPALGAQLDIPLVGVIEPGSREAVAASRAGRIGVIGTRATISSGAFQEEIARLSPEARVSARPCPLFVPLAEEGWEETEAARLVAHRYLDPLVAEGIDCLVLGCTHYPLLRPLIQEVVGGGVSLVDPGEGTARDVSHLLGEKGLLREAPGPPMHRFFVTDATPHMNTLVGSFLGRQVDEIEVVMLETLEETERSL